VAYDLDGDGKIDFEEFMKINVIFASRNTDEAINTIFNLIDRDDSKYISKEELTFVTNAIYNSLTHDEKDDLTREQLVEEIFSEIDDDRNGEISREEFLQIMHSKTNRSAIILLKKLMVLFS